VIAKIFSVTVLEIDNNFIGLCCWRYSV